MRGRQKITLATSIHLTKRNQSLKEEHKALIRMSSHWKRSYVISVGKKWHFANTFPRGPHCYNCQ